VVSGPEDEEIFVDPFGRVQVKFMWDPSDEEEHCSRWIRVATSWAGAYWGNIFNPRIGQEVVVSFSNGDPDLPVITGSVYNATQMPPYALPQHKTVSTIQTHSTPEGDPIDNYNELRFQDLRGKEQLYFQAARDKDERVNKESREFVGGNRHLIVEKSQMESVAGDKNSAVAGNHIAQIRGERHFRVDKFTIENYGGDVLQDMFSDHTVRLEGNYNRSVFEGSVRELISKGDQSTILREGSTNQLNQKGDWVLQCPEGTISGGAAMVTIGADGLMSLSCGASSIVLTKTSIAINSPLVLINSGPAEPIDPAEAAVVAPTVWPPHTELKSPAAPDAADSGGFFDKAIPGA
jgi:hypothetical protein